MNPIMAPMLPKAHVVRLITAWTGPLSVSVMGNRFPAMGQLETTSGIWTGSTGSATIELSVNHTAYPNEIPMAPNRSALRTFPSLVMTVKTLSSLRKALYGGSHKYDTC
mgnify:CR=1 FL=1